MNALVYASTFKHRPGHSLGEKNKVAQNEKREKHRWVFVYLYKIWQILKCFAALGHFIKHKPFISGEWYAIRLSYLVLEGQFKILMFLITIRYVNSKLIRLHKYWEDST